MEIITLVENLSYQQGLKGEHGLSFLIKVDGKQILFDAGQTNLLADNAKVLDIDLASVDAVVISHGHYDHTGGLESFFEINHHAPVWIKSAAFDDKFSGSHGGLRFVGMDKTIMEKYRHRFRFAEGNIEIAPGLKIITDISHYYPFEQSSSTMIVKKGNQEESDPFEDELFMLYDHPHGLTVFAGCAHLGIGNICRTAMEVTGNNHIGLVLGGTHLKGASGGRIEQTINAFSDLEVDHFGLCHCTGLPAFIAFSQAFGGRVRYAHVGTHFSPYD